MKAPDKCYITREKNGVIYSLSLNDNGGIEYIRKDIVDETIKTAEDHAYFAGQEKFRKKLIEWAKETYLDENASAIRKVCFKQLVEKLNSL